jgi:hypothetical protein
MRRHYYISKNGKFIFVLIKFNIRYQNVASFRMLKNIQEVDNGSCNKEYSAIRKTTAMPETHKMLIPLKYYAKKPAKTFSLGTESFIILIPVTE